MVRNQTYFGRVFTFLNFGIYDVIVHPPSTNLRGESNRLKNFGVDPVKNLGVYSLGITSVTAEEKLKEHLCNKSIIIILSSRLD